MTKNLRKPIWVLLSWVVVYLRAVSAFAASQGIVATQHELATEAGLVMLRKGGSAMDAAIASAFVLSVVEPYNSGLGGGGFLLSYQDGQYWFLDFRERAPKKASSQVYFQNGKFVPALRLKGWFAPGVPGTVKGLLAGHQKAGRLSLEQVLEPSIRLAEKGFMLDHEFRRRLYKQKKDLIQDPEMKRLFYPEGKTLRTGSLLVQKDLAQTLKDISRNGEQGFYEGETAAKMDRSFGQHGGWITKEDLSQYRVEFLKPLAFQYRNLTIYSAPLPSSGGGMLCQILGILEKFPMQQLPQIDRLHVLAEAMRFSFADRSQYYGDPHFVEVPLAKLLSKDYARPRQSWIQLDQRVEPKRLARLFQEQEGGHEGENTTHLVTADAHGNVVSLTQSLNTSFGAGVMIPGTGIILNNTMDDFSSFPSQGNYFGLLGSKANEMAPGKTPLSSMSPTMVTDAQNRPILVLGSPGGPRIISCVLETLVNVVDLKMKIHDAVNAPRIHHQYVPDILYMEKPGFSKTIIGDLKKRKHPIELQEPWCNVQAIAIEYGKSGIESFQYQGASDPRGQGFTLGN